MIIFDTNVVSALMRPDENQVVLTWLNNQNSDEFYLSSPTVYEILYGLAISPQGKRSERLAARFEIEMMKLFQNRVVPFDLQAAEHSSRIAAKRKLAGINIDIVDTQIAGIALANRARLATRNIRHFEDAGIELIDPWAAA